MLVAFIFPWIAVASKEETALIVIIEWNSRALYKMDDGRHRKDSRSPKFEYQLLQKVYS